MTLSRTVFMQVYDKSQGCCYYCGYPYGAIGSTLRPNPETFDRDMVIEHMTPRSKGGSDHGDNLTLACSPCNSRKAARNVEEYRIAICKRIADQAEAITDLIASSGIFANEEVLLRALHQLVNRGNAGAEKFIGEQQ